MVIKPNRLAANPLKIETDGEVICQKGLFKMLGVMFDQKLNLEEDMTKLI